MNTINFLKNEICDDIQDSCHDLVNLPKEIKRHGFSYVVRDYTLDIPQTLEKAGSLSLGFMASQGNFSHHHPCAQFACAVIILGVTCAIFEEGMNQVDLKQHTKRCVKSMAVGAITGGAAHTLNKVYQIVWYLLLAANRMSKVDSLRNNWANNQAYGHLLENHLPVCQESTSWWSYYPKRTPCAIEYTSSSHLPSHCGSSPQAPYYTTINYRTDIGKLDLISNNKLVSAIAGAGGLQSLFGLSTNAATFLRFENTLQEKPKIEKEQCECLFEESKHIGYVSLQTGTRTVTKTSGKTTKTTTVPVYSSHSVYAPFLVCAFPLKEGKLPENIPFPSLTSPDLSFTMTLLAQSVMIVAFARFKED